MSKETQKLSYVAKQAGESARALDKTKLETLMAGAVAAQDTLKCVIDAMPNTGLTIRDRDYRLTYQGELTTRLFGHRLGEKCYSVFEGNDDICEGCPAALAFEDGQPHMSLREIIMPSGNIAFWENMAYPMHDADGNISWCIEINTDITQRKGAERKLAEAAVYLDAMGMPFWCLMSRGTSSQSTKPLWNCGTTIRKRRCWA